MNNNSIVPIDPNQSPFDSIRKLRADGSEFWVARELMILMGYPRWEKFKNPLKSAIENLELNDDIVADHFSPLMVKSSGRDASDYELTRYAAYMTALCCDGRKPEVAAAKKYFATKTRQAEITPKASLALPEDFEDALVLLLETVREKKILVAANEKLLASNQSLQVEVEVLQPKADVYDTVMDSETWLDVRELFKCLAIPKYKEKDFRKFLCSQDVKILSKDTNQPYADFVQRGFAKLTPVTLPNGAVYQKPVFSWKGCERIVKALRGHGVIVDGHQIDLNLGYKVVKV
jgi:DNA-damage-inducible protein D